MSFLQNTFMKHTESTHIDFGILPSRAKIKSLPFDFTEGIISEMFIQERK